jgi:hypothetical protein
VPAQVLRIPPGVLQSLPEEPRLPDAPNLMPPRDDSFFAILHDQFAQRVHQVRPQILEPLVVRPRRKPGRAFLRRSRRAVERRDAAIVRRYRTILRKLGLAIEDGHVVKNVLLSSHDIECQVAQILSGTDFSLWGLVLASTKTHRLKSVPLHPSTRRL